MFEIAFDENPSPVSLSISSHVGELIEQRFLNEQEFNQNLGKIKSKENLDFSIVILARLRGMNEISDSINISETQLSKLNFSTIQTKVLQCANVISVPSGSGDSTLFR
jgi:hypothetical protein